MDAVELAFVMALLDVEPPGEGEQIPRLLARIGQFALDVADETLPRMVLSLRVHRRARLHCLAWA